MAVLFFDTSALIRRYDHTEPGADAVRRLCFPATGHILLITRITPIEVASALNRKYRERVLDAHDRDRLWRQFRFHRRDQYHVITPDESTFNLAENLLFSERLRAFDALQLAASLRTRILMADLTPDYRFCTADQQPAAAANNQGLAVELVR